MQKTNSMIDLEIKSIQLQLEKLSRQNDELRNLVANSQKSKPDELPEWLSVDDCAKLKGGAALNTYRCNRFLLPGAGNPKFGKLVGGRLVFNRKDVLVWVKISDAEYEDYATRVCGMAIPERYRSKLKKAKDSQ